MIFNCKKCDNPITDVVKTGPESDGLYHKRCHDEETIAKFMDMAMTKYPDKVAEYREGKTALLGLFMGEVMKLSRGEADPKMANEIIKKKLENTEKL